MQNNSNNNNNNNAHANPFRGYDKMPESTSNWILKKKAKANYPKKFNTNLSGNLDNLYVATEKAHGSNFCFIWDVIQKTLSCAKRTGILDPQDHFFGYKTILPEHSTKVEKLAGLVQAWVTKSLKKETLRVCIFGELIGGGYTGAENTKKHKEIEVELVQPEILYCPWLAFYAFDIRVLIQDTALQTQEEIFLDYDLCVELWKQAEFFYAQPLCVGPLEQCLSYPVEFETTLPPLLGMKSLGKSNQAEGVVIKAIKTTFIETTDSKSKSRAIVKNKASKFSEKVLQTGKQKHSSNFKSTGEDLVVEELLSFVTKNRLHNTISKIGKVSLSNTQSVKKLQEMMIDDVLTSFKTDNSTLFNSYNDLPEKNKQKIRRQLESEIDQLIKSNLK